MDSDAPVFPTLTPRQEEILALIIRVYSQSPEPVSSRFLSEKLSQQVSSATVRNEMAVLEELGLIYAPHTSAGRVPTENGYRYFVRFLIQANGLSDDDASVIDSQLHTAPLATEQWLNAVASALSRTTQAAALVTPPKADTSRFKHCELIAIQQRLVLMVLVLNQGAVHQHMLTLSEPLPQTRLSEAANRLNAACLDASAEDVRARLGQFAALEREIAELVADIMDRSSSEPARLVYRDGLSDLVANISQPRGAQQAVRVIEEREFLTGILNEVLTPAQRGVQVVIAGNGRWEDLSHLTMILSRYGVPGEASGAVGVIGPTNLNYGRAIGAVKHVSGVMTDMLSSALEGGETQTAAPDPADDAPPAT
jgi:heat-inducible transcriptional repressor